VRMESITKMETLNRPTMPKQLSNTWKKSETLNWPTKMTIKFISRNFATLKTRTLLYIMFGPFSPRSPRARTNGYMQNVNFLWTEVESAVRANISDPKPDISESFRHTQYPPEAVEALGPGIAPTMYRAAMPRLCIELKGPDGLMPCATKQAAYDGAVMVNAAWEAHKYMAKPADEFMGKTQALTGTVNGTSICIYANHAISSEVDASKPHPEKLQYYQFPAKGLMPILSWEDFNKARKIVRNA